MAERLDPLQRIFVAFEDALNVNTHQIVVLSGPLQLTRLREAVSRTLREFELCTSGVSENGREVVHGYWPAEAVPLYQVPFSGSISFENAAFRRMLMRLSQWNPVRWRSRPPVQFFYVTDDTGSQSALMFNCHHGIADAKADTRLLERLLQNYDLPGAGPTPIRPDTPVKVHGHIAYQRVKQEARPGRHRVSDSLAVARAVVRDVWVRCLGYAPEAPARAGDEVDFFYHVMDADTDRTIRAISKRSGHTINTVIMSALYRVLQQSHARLNKPIKILCPVSLRGLAPIEARENFQNFMIPCALNLEPSYASTAALMTAVGESVAAVKRGKIFTFADRIQMFSKLLSLPFIAPLRAWIVRFAEGSNACYSNPGVISENLEQFGSGGPRIAQYASFGCLFRPYDFILYTPQFRDRLYLNVIYRIQAFRDVAAQLVDPLKAAVAKMAEEFEIPSSEAGLQGTAREASRSALSAGSRA